MQMPKFIKRLKRKRDWYEYGRTNKQIREMQRRYEDFADCCPDYAAEIDTELDKLHVKRNRLHAILSTPEV